MKFVWDCSIGGRVKRNMNEAGQRFQVALQAAANMAASMIQTEVRAEITSLGFKKVDARQVTVGVEGTALENMQISMTINDPRIRILETGGVLEGHPLLWIPITGTDAVGTSPKDYGGGLVSSANPRTGGSGRPLLFSRADRQPKFFGIESVTVPKKLSSNEIATRVMQNFSAVFEEAWRSAK